MQTIMKSKVFVLLARGFEEADVSAVIRTLRGLGFSVSVVGLTAGPVRGAYGLSLVPDCTFSDVDMEVPRAAVLPGGILAARRFSADPRVHTLLRQVASQRGYIMAIGTARKVLHRAGVLDSPEPGPSNGSEKAKPDGEVEGWRDESSAWDGLERRPSDPVLVEGHVILSQDSGSVQEAALRLASMLER